MKFTRSLIEPNLIDMETINPLFLQTLWEIEISRWGETMTAQTSKIIYTKVDEAPLLAAYSFLPIIKAFTGAGGDGSDQSWLFLFHYRPSIMWDCS